MVGKDVAVEQPKIDGRNVLPGKHRFEPLQQVKYVQTNLTNSLQCLCGSFSFNLESKVNPIWV